MLVRDDECTSEISLLKSKRRYRRDEFKGSQWDFKSSVKNSWTNFMKDWLDKYKYWKHPVLYKGQVVVDADAMPMDDPRQFKWQQIVRNDDNYHYYRSKDYDNVGKVEVPYYLNMKDSRTIHDVLNKANSYMRRKR